MDVYKMKRVTKFKDILKVTGIPVLFASLCCLAPLVLVLLGVSTVAFGASLADNLYGNYRWAFRGLGALTLAASLFIYFRRKGICTLDQAKRRRKFILNTILLSLLVFVVSNLSKFAEKISARTFLERWIFLLFSWKGF